MPSLLFIAPADLGETVLATGALNYAIAQLNAPSVTIVCDPEADALFRAVPNLESTHAWRRDTGFVEAMGVAWTLGKQSFDVALDLRGAPLTRVEQRYVRPAARVLRHLSEDFSELLGSERTLAPQLWLDDAARSAAAQAAQGSGPLLALAPGGVSVSKRWPGERFAAVARRLTGFPLTGARVVLLGAAARDAEITRAVAASLDADGVAALDLSGRLDLNAAAALLENATLCLGNDNALTHIAAAVGAPTLTLFGPTDERVRAPHGPRARTLRGRDLETIADSALDERAAMDDLSVDAVEAAALELLHAGGLR
ncbi:glycosyltransferase family 9 protein [Terricaulis sp.]|uniref:glycosyltransferase family 9 protein n=1 Tax=Terricaulis sp. TaxID=2768686 RepID=UPI0037832E6F